MKDRPAMSEARRAQIVLASVVAATVIVLAIAFGFPDKNTPLFGLLFGPATPTATAGPVATPTPPAATSTPAPTYTVPPTLTATPTLTPTATNTGTPTPTATPHPPRCPSTSTTLCIFPASQSVYLGQQVQVLISVTNAANLGAFQATVTYDPAILTFAGAAAGPFLGASGRAVQCAQQQPAGGIFSVACFTLGPVPPDGVTGDGDLLTMTFNATAPGTSALKLSNVLITDPLANLLPAATQDGAVTVINATPTPCPGGACPTNTPTATATPYIPPSGPTTMYLNPGSVSGVIGQQFSLDVAISNAIDLGSFSFNVQFSPGSVGVAGVTAGAFLSSTGRTVFCALPEIRPDGVSLSCASQGTSLPGASGVGVLGSIGLIVRTPGAIALRVSGSLSSPLGSAEPLFTTDGSITGIAGPTATATPCPGACPSQTPPATPTPSPTPVSYPTTCTAPGTTVCVQPASQTASVGTFVEVGIVASNVTNLGAFQFTLTSDPAILAPVSTAPGAFLGSSGRTVLCAVPTVTATTAHLACGTLGGQPPAGPNGSGVVATVRYQVIGAGTSALSLSNTLITDPLGTVMPAGTTNGALTGSNATPTPCPGGVCPSATPTATPTATSTPAPISCTGATTALMCLLPSSQTVLAGSTFTVQVVADQATNIASFEFELTFDQVRVTGINAVNTPFLGSSGRTVFCPSPVIGPGSIRFGCASVGGAPPGPTAPGILATVTLQANLAGATPLHFTRSTLSDPLANPIVVTAIDGSLTIQ